VTDRRDFFSSIRKHFGQGEGGTPLLLRPPYGESESLFQSECPACESKACVASCDEKIIWITDEGIPALCFEQNGCTFCEACALACPEEVLFLSKEREVDKLNAVFKISIESCVAHDGVICYSCKEPCIDDAILFNGLFNPVIDDEKCTACGFCIARCPTQAISYEVLNLENTTKLNTLADTL